MPDTWPEMGMEAQRCGNCGKWLQIVRPGKYQCDCEHTRTIAIEDIEAFLDYVLGLEQACEYVASQDWLDTPLGVSEAVLRCAEALEVKNES